MNTTIDIKSNVEGLELYSDAYPFRLSLRIRNFENEAMYKKFIKSCEGLIRKCHEYKMWKNYIIDILQVNSCAITHEAMNEVSIEVHHHVPSLYTLVNALVNKRIEEENDFCSFDIAIDAIELHFKNKIGYVALLQSIHEKFHNGYLTIPMKLVKGDYNYFLKEYSKYLDETDLDSINSRLSISETNCTWSKDNYPAIASVQ